MENWMFLAGIFFFLFGGSAVWGIVHTVLEHRKEMAQLKHKHAGENSQLTAKNNDLQETIAHMKDRIAVLEVIATDPARQTADEIERLR